MTTPRWRQAIENALKASKKANVVQLASNDLTTLTPQVRSIIFRAFLSPEEQPNFPLFLSTTDVRSPKVAQLVASPFVQLAWWFPETEEQFRISGKAYIVPSSNNTLMKHFKQSITERNSVLSKLDASGFDWEAKRKEVFESMSPYMKASWCRPIPGSQLEGGYETAKEWPERLEPDDLDTNPEKRKHWDLAFENFSLIIVEPIEVDYVQLPDKRTRFWIGKDGWEEEAIAP